ncbi:hypothetical protein TNCV_62281 [Trichonephila clavipes]|nr:hypothetical protein TNCV_62281 [Trichonephila clavipes]
MLPEIIAVLPDTSEITDEDEGDDNEVNIGEIIIKYVPGLRGLEVDESTANDLLKQMKTALKDKTPTELFEQFYFGEVNDLIVKETVRYAAVVKPEHDFLTTAIEIRVFIGILLLTGYHSNTSERNYWPDSDTLALPW